MRVVRNDHWQTGLVAQLDDLFVDLGLFWHVIMHHHFEVVAILKDVAIPLESLVGSFHVSVLDVTGEFTRWTAGEDDNSLVVFFYNLPVHSRSIVKSLDVRSGYELHQVLVADAILREQCHVERETFLRVPFAARTVCNVSLNTDDGLDAGACC